jgi:hypothetical protein
MVLVVVYRLKLTNYLKGTRIQMSILVGISNMREGMNDGIQTTADSE